MTTIASNMASVGLKQLFERQVEAAVKLCGDRKGIEALFPLLERIGKVAEGEGKIPFVIVPWGPTLTSTTRMAQVVLDEKTGLSYLTDGLITDLDSIPQRHYLAVGIDYLGTKGKRPSDCLAQFRREGRFGGTVNEGVSAITYDPCILEKTFLDLPGSRYDSVGIPDLCVNVRPRLFAGWVGNAFPLYGSLSVRERLRLGI
jgi:hypothetical protein